MTKNFAGTQLIGVYGDNVNLRPMSGRLEATQTMAKLNNAAGGKGDVNWQPKEGINGNSHLLMQDDNNDVIANMIIDRLAK